jgi:hypothetical protein
MQLREQQPLSLKSVRKQRFTEEDLRQRSERFRQAKSDLESRMNSEEFKKMTWVKLARQKGIPYFEDFPTLDPVPLSSIECVPVKMIAFRPFIEIDKQLIEDMSWTGKDWKEEYRWDPVAREVAVVRVKINRDNKVTKKSDDDLEPGPETR